MRIVGKGIPLREGYTKVSGTEKFTPDYLPPDQIIDEVFSNEYKESRERWATHFKILLQCRDIVLPCDREPFVQIVSIKRRVLPS